MIKLKKIFLHYYDYKDEYSMEVRIGDECREVMFKMDDNNTRKAITPMLEAISEACAMSAAELKNDIITAVKSKEVDNV